MTYLLSSITLVTCWIALKYNQPLMTRYDLRTGQDLSLLMFIQTKCDMRKIFDPDSDPQDSHSEVCESEQSEGLNLTIVGLSQ